MSNLLNKAVAAFLFGYPLSRLRKDDEKQANDNMLIFVKTIMDFSDSCVGKITLSEFFSEFKHSV